VFDSANEKAAILTSAMQVSLQLLNTSSLLIETGEYFLEWVSCQLIYVCGSEFLEWGFLS
jgi:hypothetical protein